MVVIPANRVNGGGGGGGGSTGAPGASFLTGSGAPSNSLGRDGDSYMNRITGEVYTKAAGAWTDTGSSLEGPVGPSGGGGGGGGVPVASASGQTLRSTLAGSTNSVFINEPFLSWTDPRVGGLDGDSGVDQLAAWNRAVTLMPNGGKLQLPAGRILHSATPSAFPNGCTIVGASADRGTASGQEGTIVFNNGTIIQPFGAFGGVMLRFGTVIPDPAHKVPPMGGRVQNVLIDGKNQCIPASIDGWRWVMDGSTFARPGGGNPQALSINANGVIICGGCSFSGNGVGTGINQLANDLHIYDSTIQHFGRGIAGGEGIYAGNNHIFQGAVAASSVDALINLPVGVVSFIGNVIENTIGPQITINVPANALMTDIEILSNQFYWGGAATGINVQPADTYPNIKLDVSNAGAQLFGCAIHGNTFHNKIRATAIMQTIGPQANVGMFSMEHNKGRRHQHIFTPDSTFFPDAGCHGNVVWTGAPMGVGATILRDTNQGVAVFSGDGATTDFAIPHGLDGVPVYYDARGVSAAAITGGLVPSVDATNITAHFNTPPVAGANNVSITWRAALYGP